MGLRRASVETVEFTNVTALRETDLAILCTIHGDEVWIPKSQIAHESDVRSVHDKGTLIVSEWIATEKGLV